MAMPASGSLGIYTAPQTCGSISVAVYGGCYPASLHDAGYSGMGCTGTVAMSDFYGYNNTPPLVLPIKHCLTYSFGSCGVSSTVVRDFCVHNLNTMGSSDCFDLYLNFYLKRTYSFVINPNDTCSLFCILCNHTCISGLTITCNDYFQCYIFICPIRLCCGDELCYRIQGTGTVGYQTEAGGSIVMVNLTNIVGTYVLDSDETCRNCFVYTC